MVERMPPGANPGGIWVKVFTDTGVVLTDRALSAIPQAQMLGVVDHEKAMEWIEANPGHKVTLVFFDGDSGEVMKVLVKGAVGSITCPVCHRTSHNPQDVKYGYCGNCRAYTSHDRFRPPTGAWWP